MTATVQVDERPLCWPLFLTHPRRDGGLCTTSSSFFGASAHLGGFGLVLGVGTIAVCGRRNAFFQALRLCAVICSAKTTDRGELRLGLGL